MENVEIPELNGEQVKMKDKDLVLGKIKKILKDGSKKLQIITDFDRTISKHHFNGELTRSSYSIYKLIPNLPEDYIKKTAELYERFRVIEDDPNMTIEDKLPYMEEWWQLSNKSFVGLPFSQSDIDLAVKLSKVALRDGCDTAFLQLYKANIPVLVFSAGLGNIVQSIIKQYNMAYDNVKVISNFFDVKNGIIKGFKGNVLHVYNKNHHAIENSDYFNELSHRENVILMGDSLGDSNMAEGVPGNGEVLKIGFLSTNIEDYLPQYLNHFDIVLIDDQTLNVFNALLKLILNEI